MKIRIEIIDDFEVYNEKSIHTLNFGNLPKDKAQIIYDKLYKILSEDVKLKIDKIAKE